MELKQLEYFRTIVDAGTISGAARDLHMTQPPLSYQIKMLEEELQVPLFLRGKKRITLTEAGKTLYEQAGNLLMLSDLAKRSRDLEKQADAWSKQLDKEGKKLSASLQARLCNGTSP